MLQKIFEHLKSKIKYYDYLFLLDTTRSKFELAGDAATKRQSKEELKNMKMAKNDDINSQIVKWQMDWHSARTFRRCARKDRRQPVLYTNCLLQCFVHSVAVCLKNSLMITILTLDGIPLAPKYLRILADGLANNRNLQNLSLARCRIGDMGSLKFVKYLNFSNNQYKSGIISTYFKYNFLL